MYKVRFSSVEWESVKTVSHYGIRQYGMTPVKISLQIIHILLDFLDSRHFFEMILKTERKI